MLQAVHAQITRLALADIFSPLALQAIIASNVRVDSLKNQLGHDEYHFDNNSFEQSRVFMEEQRRLIRPALEGGNALQAWQAFGRLTHTAQDFYAHSNYVALWLASRPSDMPPAASEIDPLDASLIANPSLHSGKPYHPFGVLSFIPGLRPLMVPLLPADSHARMNLDSPARGPLFEYAFQAAIKRTQYEYQIVARSLPENRLTHLLGFSEFQAQLPLTP